MTDTHTDTHNEYEPGDHFHLGGADTENLEVWVSSRSDAADFWDGNWLLCQIRIAVGAFNACFAANIRTDELERFHVGVRTLYDDLRTTAKLETMEGQLKLALEGDGRGHVHCAEEARDVAGTGNLLQFGLYIDQTHLFGTMVELGELLNRYPVRGSPAA